MAATTIFSGLVASRADASVAQVTGDVKGTAAYTNSACGQFESEMQHFNGTIAANDGGTARITTNVCIDFLGDCGCIPEVESVAFKITRGTRSISGNGSGNVGNTSTPGVYGFGLHLVVRRGATSLVPMGTHLKFTGWWKEPSPGHTVMKGHVRRDS